MAAVDGVFQYREGRLCAEACALDALAAQFGTPLYVYSQRAITDAHAAFTDGLAGTSHRICYAVKANANLALLRLLAGLGAGFDIVSVGELERVLRAGGDARRVVFSSVGKREDELQRALAAGIHCFNVESEAELLRLNAVSLEMQRRAPVALRINPRLETNTHPYISTGHARAKFGIEAATAEALVQRALALPGVRLIGLACHVGSQLTDTDAYAEAARALVALADRVEAQGVALEHLDFGGGFGIRYRDETPPSPAEFLAAARAALGSRKLTLMVEPGRALVGAAGILLTRIEYVKPTPDVNWLILDAGMTELMRPTLYNAWHGVREVAPRAAEEAAVYDLAGAVCESADVLARDRRLAVRAGDLLAIMDCGAYGASMALSYNSRPRAAEVLVNGGEARLIRRRETLDDLLAAEMSPD
ncbi:MAG TPA: diaminopimelate decarboxylase [Gammaproteobacteria bacterium]|nr:diaminopimelate decarboxylase [Gammaproteobacteria bacterium]